MGYINPLLRLPAAKKLQALPADQRAPLEQLLRELRAVATYARHVAHVLRQGGRCG